jgi:hypothetical protein
MLSTIFFAPACDLITIESWDSNQKQRNQNKYNLVYNRMGGEVSHKQQ